VLLTEKMVEEAIEIIKPTINGLFTNNKAVWGPTWVEIFISIPTIDKPIHVTVGNKTEWNPSWKKKDLMDIARKKMEASKRTKKDTRSLLSRSPYLFKEGEYLYMGGIYHDEISVGTSGLNGIFDELVSNLVIDTILSLVRFKTWNMSHAGKNAIE
jgi:hypothetical protein